MNALGSGKFEKSKNYFFCLTFLKTEFLDGELPAGLVLVSPYQKYQVLDVHTFETTQWNSSILIEVTFKL